MSHRTPSASTNAAPLERNETAVRAHLLGKRYEIYDRPHHRLIRQIFPKARHLGREFWALRGVGFEIRRGETVGVIGRNGSGKSTLLQLICGTLPKTEGRIEVNGRVAALLELGAGFNPEFTGVENVVLNASILGLSREEIDARMEAILEFAGIGDFAWQPVKLYSSGMFLRLAFAVVAHVDADILVVDEALAVGDVLFTQKCMRFLRRFRKEGTLLFVSHDVGMVTGLCDRAIWLEQGEMRMIGDVKSVTNSYLEHIYAEQQDISPVISNTNVDSPAPPQPFSADVRRELLLHSNLRNDIKVPAFDSLASGFGTGCARITHVGFQDDDGGALPWVIGGEILTLEIQFSADHEINGVIIGFMIKDRLGQVLFGENTFLTYRDTPLNMNPGDSGTARFRFRMPYLPVGDYVVTASVTEGTQENHVLHHWMHEALVFSCNSSHMVFGLVGVPMASINMAVSPPAVTQVIAKAPN